MSFVTHPANLWCHFCYLKSYWIVNRRIYVYNYSISYNLNTFLINTYVFTVPFPRTSFRSLSSFSAVSPGCYKSDPLIRALDKSLGPWASSISESLNIPAPLRTATSSLYCRYHQLSVRRTPLLRWACMWSV